MITKEELKRYTRDKECEYILDFTDENVSLVSLEYDNSVCWASSIRSLCRRRKNIQTMLVNCWNGVVDYRLPYYQELVEYFPYLKPEFTVEGNSIYCKLTVDTKYSEYPFGFLIAVRMGWEYLNHWPIQNNPPTVREVWRAVLDSEGYTKSFSRGDYYLNTSPHFYDIHTWWSEPTKQLCKLGLSADKLIEVELKIWKEHLLEERDRAEWSPDLRAPLYRKVIEIAGGNVKEIDPFEW